MKPISRGVCGLIFDVAFLLAAAGVVWLLLRAVRVAGCW